MSKKHSAFNQEQYKLAKKYGLAHGYYGTVGGWIWKGGAMVPVVHGWGQFWGYIGGTRITEWAKRQGIPVSEKIDLIYTPKP